MATTPECAWIAGHGDGFDTECAWCHAWRDDPSFVPGKAWKDSEASRAMSLPPRPHNKAFDRSCCRTNVDQPHDAYCVSQPAPGMVEVNPADPKLVAQIDQKAAETSEALDRHGAQCHRHRAGRAVARPRGRIPTMTENPPIEPIERAAPLDPNDPEAVVDPDNPSGTLPEYTTNYDHGEDTTLYACPQCSNPGQYGPSYSFAICPECGWPGGPREQHVEANP